MFFKSLPKWIILSTGTIALISIASVGVVGKVYQQKVMAAYQEVQTAINKPENETIFTKIKQAILQIKNIDVSATIDEFKGQLGNIKLFLSLNISNNSNTLGNFVSQLQTWKSLLESNQSIIGNASQATINQINNAITSITNIGNQSNTIFAHIEKEVGRFEGPIKQYLDKNSNVLHQIDYYTDQANSIYKTISSFTKQTPVETVNNYYSIATTTMIAVPATLLGLSFLSFIIFNIFYKNIDGKYYSRNRTKGLKQAKKHIEILSRKFSKE